MRIPAPWWLRLRALWCRCRCHRLPDWTADYGDDPDEIRRHLESYGPSTPTHHGRACCSRYCGTVNYGWSGMRFL